MNENNVVQTWVCSLTMMQQSVLLSCIRGADGLPKRHVSKFVLRWYRRCILLSAMDKRAITDPYDGGGGNFTGPIPREMTVEGLFAAYLDSHDEVPHHFHMHLVHAVEILGYKHPNAEIRRQWFEFYQRCARDLHMRTESETEMDFRLGDNKAQWQAAGGEVLDMGREARSA